MGAVPVLMATSVSTLIATNSKNLLDDWPKIGYSKGPDLGSDSKVATNAEIFIWFSASSGVLGGAPFDLFP